MSARVILATILSMALLVAVLVDAFEVMLLPRRVRRRNRFVRWFFVTAWAIWDWIGCRLPSGARRERFLSIFGPLSMVVLLAIWASALIAAFGTIQWVLQQGVRPAVSLTNQLYMSGVTFLTLGYGDVVPRTGPAKVVAVLEAATGFGLIAVIIGYLPVLYQLFSRREAHVIRLDARAGSPPTAATLLTRHADGERMDALDGLLLEWEQWSAELLESHLSYPMLAYYRSQHDNESWLSALTAVLDACAVVLVGLSGVNTFQARMTFATTRLAVIEMARVLAAPDISIAGEQARTGRLPPAEFGRLREMLEDSGLVFSSPDTAEAELAAFRDAYEPFVVAIGEYLSLGVPPWIASEGALDNWQRSKGAVRIKELVESVEAKPQ